MANEEYYRIGPKLSNIDFYIGVNILPIQPIVINTSSTVSSTSVKIAKASIISSINLSTSATSIRVTKASVSVGVSTSVSAGSSEILLLDAAMQISSSSIIRSPIRFSPGYIDQSSIRTKILIDGKPISNHNRQFDENAVLVFIENRNWNNTKNRYYKKPSSSGRKSFNLSWSMLPGKAEQTVDKANGRDYLNAIAEDPDSHILTIINEDSNGLTPYTETNYNVFIRSYSETLIRRSIPEGVYLFDCTLAMEEA